MDPRLQIVIAVMEENLQDELSLEELARSSNISLSHFHHLFKALTGDSPANYLRALRMERARQLLRTTELSVKEVMSRTGIKDRSHFEREFKKVYGITPAKYHKAELLNRWIHRNT